MKKTKEEILEGATYEYNANGKRDFVAFTPDQRLVIYDAMEEYATQEQSEAVELLQELFDLQNGPPLETYRKQWELVMDKISIFLKEKGGEG